jgi:beta-propeller uncharacterized protein DUF5122
LQVPGDLAHAVAVQPDQKIVIAGQANVLAIDASSHLAFARFNPNGTHDGSFGYPPNAGAAPGVTAVAGDDKVAVRPQNPFGTGASFEDVAFGLLVQRDGKVVGAGFADMPGVSGFAIVRLR